MTKNLIKNILNALGLYNIGRKIIIKAYYPYKYYRLKKVVKPILNILNKVCEENCEDFWLDYGTLLGFVRDKKIIKNDLDLDFAIKPKEGINLSNILKDKGIYLTRQCIVEGIITMEQYQYKGVGFDIFYYKNSSNNEITTNIWYPNDYSIPQKTSYSKGLGNIREIKFTDVTTHKIEFYTAPFRIPVNSSLYLSENYGANFIVPDSNFTHDDEQNCKIINKEFEVIFYG